MPDDPLTKTERDKESADSAERMLFERMAITQSQARLHLATVAASLQSQNPIQLPQQTNQPIPIPTGVISATAFPPPPLTLGLQQNNPSGAVGGGSAPPALPLQGVNTNVNGQPATQQLNGQPPVLL